MVMQSQKLLNISSTTPVTPNETSTYKTYSFKEMVNFFDKDSLEMASEFDSKYMNWESSRSLHYSLWYVELILVEDF